jgi:hypothetical protein
MDKTKYKSDFKNIQNLVNSFDFCGLIESGAPINEYESLTNILISSLYNKKSKLEIENALINEIENYYGVGKIENEKSIKELKNRIESLINKCEFEMQNKPSH